MCFNNVILVLAAAIAAQTAVANDLLPGHWLTKPGDRKVELRADGSINGKVDDKRDFIAYEWVSAPDGSPYVLFTEEDGDIYYHPVLATDEVQIDGEATRRIVLGAYFGRALVLVEATETQLARVEAEKLRDRQERCIRNKLLRISSAGVDYVLQADRDSVGDAELVKGGFDGVEAVAGESYGGLTISAHGGKLKVTTAAGWDVNYEY